MDNNNINKTLPSDVSLETVQLNRLLTQKEQKVFSDSTKEALRLLGKYNKEFPTKPTLNEVSIIPKSEITNVALAVLKLPCIEA